MLHCRGPFVGWIGRIGRGQAAQPTRKVTADTAADIRFLPIHLAAMVAAETAAAQGARAAGGGGGGSLEARVDLPSLTGTA